MVTQDPNIAGHRDGRFRHRRNSVLVCQPFSRLIGIGKNILNLFVGESEEVEVEVIVPERLDRGAEDLLIPARIERQFVVRDDVRPALSIAEVVQNRLILQLLDEYTLPA